MYVASWNEGQLHFAMGANETHWTQVFSPRLVHVRRMSQAFFTSSTPLPALDEDEEEEDEEEEDDAQPAATRSASVARNVGRRSMSVT